jgi:SWI/SNF chromatin-remodeling complex subunit SWI1
VDIEALTMSLRSRISTELSYALTTITILTLLRIKEGAFLISQIPDLFEELLDLLEDVAFDAPEETDEDDHPDTPILTHHELMNMLIEEGNSPFASLKPKQGLKDPSSGPTQRPGDIILAITNIIRNLALSTENHDYLARHERVFGLMLRLCSHKRPSPSEAPVPLSPALSLNDLVVIRKDVVYFLINIVSAVHLANTPSSPSPAEMRRARRAYELLVSYFIDPVEAVAPYACLLLTSIPAHLANSKPPLAIDSALEVFTRLSLTDDNRLMLCKSIPQKWLWSTIEALVHRLPLDQSDFQVVVRSEWLGYMERVIMSLYSIAFFAPPAIKKRMKTDRQLCFTKVFLRLIKRLSIHTSPEIRATFAVALRRAIETLKLVDDAGDSFDASPSTMPTLAFGMGYGEHGEAKVEKGMGLLSGYQEEITWGLMVQKDMDDLVFSELASLVRVEPIP